ncbi:MAG: hypothetical protein F6K42_26895 [Leptolyngbya sp. SIO1D8]|nr:hypothetical protein [Leptolyngbya sp. SIO1D8]
MPKLLQALKEIWNIHCDFKGLLSVNPDAARNLFLLGVIAQVLGESQSLRKFVMTLRIDIRRNGFLTVSNQRQLKHKLLKVKEILDNSSKAYRDLIREFSEE